MPTDLPYLKIYDIPTATTVVKNEKPPPIYLREATIKEVSESLKTVYSNDFNVIFQQKGTSMKLKEK